MIAIQNRRNNIQFGNGLPFFKTTYYQNRNRNGMNWKQGCMISPRDRVPTFQVASETQLDVCNILDENDNIITALSIGANATDDIIEKQLNDGRYIYICYDQPKGIGISGFFYIGLRLSSDPADEYRLVSEFFECQAFGCYPIGLSTPNT